MIDTFFKEKIIIKKIIIAIIFVFMFNFTFSYLGNNIVFAAGQTANNTPKPQVGEEIKEDEIKGGRLILPIQQLLIAVADAVLQIMQHSFIDANMDVTITARSKDMTTFNGWNILWLALGAVAIVVRCMFCLDWCRSGY